VTRLLHGLGVSGGEAAGPVARLAPPPAIPPDDRPVDDVEAEVLRATGALESVAEELERRATGLPSPARDVLAAQAMIARDPVLGEGITARIRAGRDGPHAVADAFGEHRRMLESLGGYLAERAADLDDLRDRAVAALLGLPMPGVPDPEHPFVLVAADLAPADTAVLDPERVLAIVTERGGPTGHTAILAKQLAIPAVTACAEAATLAEGDRVLVDGAAGSVLVEPNDEQVDDAAARSVRAAERRASSHGPGRTSDGRPIPLLANIGSPRDVEDAATAAEGVGLLRTEFLFLDRTTPPTVAEQRDAYSGIFRAFGDRRVVVRTLDIGADKPLAYMPTREEPNPALGVRGLRLARAHPELLDEQLRAIAEAAAKSDTDVWVMAPMVATADEARSFVAAARERGLGPVGVMIEVPSAALMAADILREVDFASIGTNDLAQYTLAADRLAGELAELLDPWQPSVLRLIENVAHASAELGRPVGVCGEAASDPLLALVLVGLGVTSLSMAASCLPDVRAELASNSSKECTELSAIALDAPSAALARAGVADYTRRPARLPA
jgi:phosphoenolpyruvate-protein phosphotransferase (PTS system enzyme I)